MKKVGLLLIFSCLVLGAHSTGTHMCRPPPLLKNGLVRGNLQPSYNIGGYVEFLCNPGFQLQGESLTVCIDSQDGGVWNKPTPICVPVNCGYPPSLSNGLVTVREGTRAGATISYSCNDGYSLVGSSVRTCREDGQWSPAAPKCQLLQCPALRIIPNGGIHTSNRNFPGSVATYSCVRGYVIAGNDKRTCDSSGVWSDNEPSCQLVDCGPAPVPVNGNTRAPDGTVFNRDVWYSCNDGYDLVGSESATCLANGQWSPVAPTCRLRPVNCDNLVAPNKGFVEVSGTSVGSTATYSCIPGYTLAGGSQVRTCQQSGQWSGSAGFCRAVNCEFLLPPFNGRVLFRTTVVGSIANYQCNQGYSLVGASSRQCRDAGNVGQWSGQAPTCTAIDCGTLPSIVNGDVSFTNGNTNRGAAAVYSCDLGYELFGVRERICLSTGEWSGTEPQCGIINCDTLPAPRNGLVELSGTSVGDKATYICNSGFVMVGGNKKRDCLENGEWSGEAPSCDPTFCPHLPDPPRGLVRVASTAVGARATYECFRGYILDGNVFRTCSGSGEWTGVEPVCLLVDCNGLEDPDNGRVSFSGTDFGSRARYRCFPGYTLQGDVTRLCEDDGLWSGEAPTCIFDGCGYLDPPANGLVELSGMSVGSIATYTCDPGYVLVGKFPTRSCQNNGKWSGIAPQCRPVKPPEVTCPYLDSPQNGRVSQSSVSVGSLATYICNLGFDLIGDSSRRCLSNGRWSGSEPICRFKPPEVTCPYLDSPQNGRVSQSSVSVGSLATYICNLGFDLIGDSSRRCLSNGRWSGSEPTCRSIPNEIVFAFSRGTYSVNEGDRVVTVTVDLITGTLSEPTPVTISTDDLTAIDNIDVFGCFDYTRTTSTVTFPAGASPGGPRSQRTITIPINDDNCVEKPESFTVEITSTNPDVTFPEGRTSTVSIEDNDIPLYRFTEPSYTVDEDDGPAVPAIELYSNTVLTFPATVQVVDIRGGTATDGVDYRGVSVNVVFPAGSGRGTKVSFNIPIIDDQLVEGDETILLEATTEAPGQVPSRGNQTTVVIRDNDQCIVGLESRSYTVLEANILQEVCVVKRNAAQLSSNVDVRVFTRDISGGATAGSDYTSLPSGTTVTFGPGRSPRQCVRIPILEDNRDEPNEKFEVIIESENDDVAIQPGEDAAEVTITDDDVLDFAFSRVSYNVNEGDDTAEVCVDLVAGIPQNQVQIQLSTSDGSATSIFGGVDFTRTTSSVIFAAGTTPGGRGSHMCIEIPINDDELVEGREDFHVVATSTDDMVMFPNGRTTTVTIEDNDVPIFQFTEPTYSVDEDDGPAQPSIELVEGILTFPINVVVRDVTGGTATDGVDYTGVQTTLVFPADSRPGTEITFNIPITDDDLVEPRESINLEGTITSETGQFEPERDIARVFIDDNDVIMCDRLSDPVNGDVTLSGLIVGSTATYTCDRDYELVGFPVRTCLRNGRWSGRAPTCMRITCERLRDPSNGDVFLTGITVGSTATYTCDDGFILIGEDTRRCQNNMEWSGRAPVCRPNEIVFAFSRGTYNVNEGDRVVTVTVDLITGTLSEPTPVTISTDDLTAIDNIDVFGCFDYTRTTSTVTFPAGASPGGPRSQRTITIPINDDNCVEKAENFTVEITSTNPDVTFPRESTSTVSIEDNDIPLYRFTEPSYTVNEDDGPAVPAIELYSNTVLTFPATVRVVDIRGGTATDGVDYRGVSVNVVFPAGSGRGTEVSFNIPIIDDQLVERDETILLEATTEAPGQVPSRGNQTTVVIRDNDECIVGLESRSYTVLEANILQEVCVIKRNAAQLSSNVDVRVFTRDISGGATAGSDYTSLPSGTTVTFGPGRSPRQCVRIPILEDNRDEPNEKFEVIIESEDDDVTIQPGEDTAEVTITDDDVLDFAFSRVSYNVNEGDDTAEVCVDLVAGVPQNQVQIQLSTSDGSATSIFGGVDFTRTTSSVIFAAGTTPGGRGSQMCIEIPINDDELVERREDFHVVATSTDDMVMFPNGRTTTVTIEDNDVPIFQFTEPTYSVDEDDGPAQPSIELVEGILTFPINVVVRDVTGGTATDGVDYTGVQATLVFPADSRPGTEITFNIPITDDDLVEPRESINLEGTITSETGQFEPERDIATVFIDDNDVIMCDRLSDPVNGDVTLSGRIVGSTATYICDRDYKLVGFPVRTCLRNGRWSGRAPTCMRITCERLRDPSNGDVFLTGITVGSTATYTCDDGFILIGEDTRRCQNNMEWSGRAPVCRPNEIVFEFSQRTYSVNEGDRVVTVTVNLITGTLSEPTPVTISTDDLTAIDNIDVFGCFDYTRTTSTVTFPAGASPGGPRSQRTITIPINDDNCVEKTENFRVEITSTNPDVTFPEGSTSTVSIEDNDIPLYRFTEPSYTVNEDDGPAVPAIELYSNTVLTFPATVRVVDIRGGTATDGVDYRGVSVNVVFPAGSGRGTEVSFNIPIIDDQLVERDETILLEATTEAPGQVPSRGNQTTVVIRDNDEPIVCDRLRNPSNGDVSITGITVGSTATYKCDRGFLLVGDRVRTCESDGEWSGRAPTCRRIPVCDRLSDPSNGDVSLTGITVGSTATYKCDRGFLLVGDRVRTCESDGEWSGRAPTCRRIITCERLSNPANGRVIVRGLTVGSTASYICNSGFTLVGSQTRRCQSNGDWSGRAPTCNKRIVDCGDLFDPHNGDVQFSSTILNSKATYSCDKGYVLIGQVVRTCRADGFWSGEAPHCARPVPQECPTLSNPSNGKVKFGPSGRHVGAEVWYSCNTGFKLIGAESRRCQSNLKWSAEAPTCQARDCGTPEVCSNCIVKYKTTSIGSKAWYSCKPGYIRVGAESRTCSSNLQWSPSVPSCRRPAGCTIPTAPSNGYAYVSCTNVGCRATYWCRSGYSLSGSRKVICQSSGRWSSATPTCRRHYRG